MNTIADKIDQRIVISLRREFHVDILPEDFKGSEDTDEIFKRYGIDPEAAARVVEQAIADFDPWA